MKKTTGSHGALLGAEQVRELEQGMRGALLTPDSPDYDRAREIWNAMIDKRPALIARCAGAADVAQAVTLARRHELLVSVRGGGHNIAGKAVCDGGLMIDLSAMRSVRIDPDARTARVEGGCLLADLDHDAQVFGLATPLGINSTTGVAGLTLGGGFGWISRKFGMTVDNLLGADVVTAEGELLQAAEDRNQDLFWALRGGSGNFGVVTSFKYRLHPVGPQVLSGLLFYPFDKGEEVLRRYRDFAAGVPDDLTVWVVLRKAPPLPPVPAEWHGKDVVILAVCYCGDLDEGRRILQPLRRFGPPLADLIQPMPYAVWQKSFDPLVSPRARNYWKSHNFIDLSDALLATLLDFSGRLPTPMCEVFLGQVGGAAARVPSEATAYAHRDARFVLNVHTRWEDPGQDSECVAWAREFFRTTQPYASGGVYVNFMPEDETSRVRDAYGANYDRLAVLKKKYDPSNFFRMNQNIQPAV